MRIAAAILAALLLTVAPATAAQYPAVLIVSRVDAAHDQITLEDYSGHTWTYPGAEDWTPGDVAAAIMEDHDTPTITDDTIISIEYSAMDLRKPSTAPHALPVNARPSRRAFFMPK